MGSFSSRGPNLPALGVLKPDITAPGVDVLAAWEGLRTPDDPEQYNVISGTSMSSPHVAGAGALVRAARPDWTPDEVRSALMATGFTEPPGTGEEVQQILKEDGTPSDPFDRGAGRIDLRRAALAGLVLHEVPDAYTAADPAAGGDPTTLNLPSLADASCETTCSWTRELRSTAEAEVTWTTAGVATTDGIALTVEPAEVTVSPGETATVTVTADVSTSPGACWQFGEVQLTPDVAAVPTAHLPVAVLPDAGPCGVDVELRTLHFRGNVGDEFGCTGDGRLDLEVCGGPFLIEDDELSANPAARWVDTSIVRGTATRTPFTANWEWRLDDPVALQGPMKLQWWASCEACNLALFDDWDVRLWADGGDEPAFEQRVRTNMPLPEAAELLEATVDLPLIEATESLVVDMHPVFVNQASSTVYYDSTLPCPGGTVAPCDSFVVMPLLVDDAAADVDLAVTDIEPVEIPGRERQGGPRYRVMATITNVGEADAEGSHTELFLTGPDRNDLLGVVATPAIAAGTSVQVEAPLDARGLRGEYVVVVTADVLGELADVDRADNVGRLVTETQGNQVREHRFE